MFQCFILTWNHGFSEFLSHDDWQQAWPDRRSSQYSAFWHAMTL